MYGRSQQFPTSIGAQTYCPVYSRSIVSLSQQFPTSIGAQTRSGSGRIRTPKRPSSSRLRSVLRHAEAKLAQFRAESQQFPTSIGAQTLADLK